MMTGVQHFRFIGDQHDYTFRFYPNGSVQIFDNLRQTAVRPKDLSGEPLLFYARKNLQWIKNKLRQAGAHRAG